MAKSDELKVFLRNINRMVQNVKAMITSSAGSSLNTDELTCDAYHYEFKTSVNECFCFIYKVGYLSFEDSISDYNVSLTTACFVSRLATAHNSN